jgi:hypothetical protein
MMIIRSRRPGFRLWRDPDAGWNLKVLWWIVAFQIVRVKP